MCAVTYKRYVYTELAGLSVVGTEKLFIYLSYSCDTCGAEKSDTDEIGLIISMTKLNVFWGDLPQLEVSLDEVCE